MPEAAGQCLEFRVMKGERGGCAELQEAALAEGGGKTGANHASHTLGAGMPTGPSCAACNRVAFWWSERSPCVPLTEYSTYRYRICFHSGDELR